jgi:hypothetical protein
MSRVSNQEEFVADDRVRFHFKPNFDGYAYVYYIENDGKGDKTLLFPSAQLTDNKVKAGDDLTLPFNKNGHAAWLKFDNTPGTEVVRIIVSRDKLDEKSQGGGKDVKPDVSVTSDAKHSGKMPDKTYLSIEPVGGMALGERRLSLDAGEVTVVSADPAKPLSADISLSHKK